MDFDALVLNLPITSTVLAGFPGGQCDGDTFSVTGQTGFSPPVVCGILTGQHSKNEKEKFVKMFMDQCFKQ